MQLALNLIHFFHSKVFCDMCFGYAHCTMYFCTSTIWYHYEKINCYNLPGHDYSIFVLLIFLEMLSSILTTLDCVKRCKQLWYLLVIIPFYVHSISRLGCGHEDAKEIMEHSFFASINWDDLYQKKVSQRSKVSIKITWLEVNRDIAWTVLNKNA